MAVTSSKILQRILEVLSENPNGIPQSHLHRAVGASKSYVSMVLRDMERLGIIHRTRVGNLYIVKPVGRASQVDKRLRLGIVWSGEYLFLGHFAKALRDRLSIDLAVNVYSSALQAASAIVRGEVDAVLSPLVTQLYTYIVTKGIVVAGGGAGGGAKIYEFPRSRSSIAISSEVSSMDLCRVVAVKRGMIEDGVRYFTMPSEAVEFVRMGKARHAVLWFPLTEHVKQVEHRVVAECSEFEELTHCCTLALSRSVGMELIEKISQVYRHSIGEFLKQPLKYIEWYSSITGIDAATLKEGLKIYSYTPEINIKAVQRVVDTLGISLPHRGTLLNAILHSA